VSVVNGRVEYSKNGRVYYQSKTTASYPLVADTALYESGSEVSHAKVATAGSGESTPPPPPPPTSTGTVASWVNLVNSTFTSPTLQKSAGCAGCPDAGATTQQVFSSTGGYLEFTVGETNLLRAVGLGTPGANPITMNMPFAIRIQGGRAEVRESGTYKSEANVAIGDVLRITVANGQISYSKNGAVFYTSTLAASGQLAGYALFYDLNASVTSASISGQ
jgi:hypothetical protein